MRKIAKNHVRLRKIQTKLSTNWRGRGKGAQGGGGETSRCKYVQFVVVAVVFWASYEYGAMATLLPLILCCLLFYASERGQVRNRLEWGGGG